jgi:hypothetical protein
MTLLAEVVIERPGRNALAHLCAAGVRGAEVDPEPHSGVDYIVAKWGAGVVVASGAWNCRGDEGELQAVRVERVR